MTDENMITTKQLAERLGVTPMTVLRKVKNGIIPAYEINTRGDKRYYLSEVLEALKDIKRNNHSDTEEYWTKHLGERGKHVYKNDNPYNEESERMERRIMGDEQNPHKE